ncbi:hypothetical protein HYV88_05815 [Candidatus Woesearchaeota archaeon]|nr:hypothetical protein [Candidatus Woesearchaeota archaeon]
MEKKQKKFFTTMIVLAIIISLIITLLIVNLGSPVQEVGRETNTVYLQPEEKGQTGFVKAVVVEEEETGNE